PATRSAASPRPTRSATAPATAPNGRLVGRSYSGPVRPAAVRGAHASCRAEPSVDSGGNPVRYPADNMLDGVAGTAWRCPGDGRGVILTFHLQRPQRIAQVGLVPGYAKTDAFSGADRYAENRRVARVRWSFDGRAWAEQTFRTGPRTRDLQTVRIPPVRARRVTVTIRDSVPARRNTVAVSSAHLAVPAG
ncbi:MAG: discoidin domain-containing protein, partial [Actinomycetota bacterium]|nr:discoidin domain-containing protein [Actinomycetota bacterium]